MVVDSAGLATAVGSGVSVAVRAEGEGSDASESPLTTDADGFIVGGELAAIDPGTLVYFRVENYAGLSASAGQYTTP